MPPQGPPAAAAPGSEPPPPGGLLPGAGAAVPASEVASAFRTNAALADQKFRGKRVQVTGAVLRIKRKGTDAEGKIVYELLMAADRPAGKGEGTPGEPRARPRESEAVVSFEFTEAARDELAKLNPGQRLSIEGYPEGHATREEHGYEVVYFFKCKIVKVGD
jgi:hypothetical protein